MQPIQHAGIIVLGIFTMVIISMSGLAAAGMSSANYKITTAVVSCGCGAMESANYQMNSTLGQPSPLMEQGIWTLTQTSRTC